MRSLNLGELLYEYHLDITGMAEYGLSFAGLMAGEAALGPEGARFDVAFEGRVTGKLAGTVKGVDYLRLRADGRFELDIRAEISTDDGHRIALKADGVCLPQPDSTVAELKENVTLFTSSPAYAWLNPLQVWGLGTVDLATNTIHIRGYVA